MESSHGLAALVRGRGLLMAVVLNDSNAGDLEQAARANGLLVNAVSANAIRIAPALTITDEDVAEALIRWGAASAEVAR